MAFRDRTAAFRRLPCGDDTPPPPPHSATIDVTPEWFSTYLSLLPSFDVLRDQVQELEGLHRKIVNVVFDIETSAQYDAERSRLEVCIQQGLAQARHKQLELLTHTEANLPANQVVQRQVLLSATRRLGSLLQVAVTAFQTTQAVFQAALERQSREARAHGFGAAEEEEEEEEEEKKHAEEALLWVQGDDQQQQQQQRRHQSIVKVARSIAELQVLGLQINTLVTDQGSMLDRIDTHIVQARDNVQKGARELERANIHSSHNGRLWLGCCGSWLFILIVLVIVFIWKHS